MITILQNTDLHNLPHVVTMNVFAHEVGHSFGAKVIFTFYILKSYILRELSLAILSNVYTVVALKSITMLLITYNWCK